MSLREIGIEEARGYFARLPSRQQIATLSPDYVAIDALRDKSLTPVWLLFEDKAQHYFWMHGVHRGMVAGTDMCDFQSPYGYGGPVHLSIPDLTPEYDFLFLAWSEYRKWCWEHGIIAEFARLHPMLDQPYGGEKKLNRQTVAVPIGAKFDAACRNKCRKAVRDGVRVFEHPRRDIMLFMAHYYEGLKNLGAEKFYFFNEDYFRALSEWDKAHLMIASIDDCFVSACILLEGEELMESHLTVTTGRGYETAATNALVASALLFTAAHHKKYLYLGGGKTSEGGDPLLTFKKSFGGELRPFYTGQSVHRPDTYYALQEKHFDAPQVFGEKVLFWR